MKTTYDVFAETNPAYLAFLLYRFVREFMKQSAEAPSVSLAYIVVPLSLSESLAESFDSTNMTTGLMGWVNRFPEARLSLMRNLEASKTLTSDGLRVALHANLLRLTSDGEIALGDAKKPPENTNEKLPSGPKKAIRRAERLGRWMSKAGGPALIFSVLEVSP